VRNDVNRRLVPANAADVLDELNEQRKPLMITQNGEAAVLQDVASYEEIQETMALLKILALGNKQIAEGKVMSVAEVVKRLGAKGSTSDGGGNFVTTDLQREPRKEMR
jgi:prevent-host-death family protein